MVHFSTKKVVKIILVCVLSGIIGVVAYKQTYFFQNLIDNLVIEYNTQRYSVSDNDIDPMDESLDFEDIGMFFADVTTGSDYLLEEETPLFASLVSSGMIVSGNQDTMSGTQERESMTKLLQRRLDYYKTYKKELGM